MNLRKLLFAQIFCAIGCSVVAQDANVDINLNMKHSVDGVSNFGRERRMTIHSALSEAEWNGHEDMLDYLLNDLDVYFGRETGHATYWSAFNEEDPNKPGWVNEAKMVEQGQGVKDWYETDDFSHRHQYEARSKNMIRGINDFCPMYPNISWYPGFGKGAGGWFVKDVDAAADWVGAFMENYYAQDEGENGEPLPKYWECYNEPDMNFMNVSFGMIVSSLEKNWEYHKNVAREVRTRLGDKAPLIGGMTWGQLDLYKGDGINRTDGGSWYAGSSEEACKLYDNMLSGVDKNGGVEHPGVGLDTWPKAWDNKGSDWWQWDFMYQGFIDYCGADMDFYGVHMYDWPQENPLSDKANARAGGHTEAYLDMFEWYDNLKFGQKKDIVLSEFGAVNGAYIHSLPTGERDWPFIRAFNQMQMQFLERPSHVVYSMPFAPVKGRWGAFEGNPIIRYEGATLMDPLGTWNGNPNKDEPSEGWGWSTIIHFFELWKDVEGTRIDTKSSNIDVQVDAYVNGKHAYLILNNAIDDTKTINLNFFNSANSNEVSNVEFRHLYLGDDRIPKYTVTQMTSAPGQVTLKPNSTIILDYTFASDVAINQESKETKYMCEPLAGTQKNKRGTQLCHTASQASITATVQGVKKPAKGEAVIRIGGFFTNPSDGTVDGTVGTKVKKLKVNNKDVIVDADQFVANTRGYGIGNYKGSWFGVLELECPIDVLKDGENTVFFERWQGVEFTTIMIQVFDMSAEPGRTTQGSVVSGLAFNASSVDLMKGQTLGLAPVFTPGNASDKGLTWVSSNTSVATVDENGVVIALAASGSTVITATSTANSSVSTTITVNAKAYAASTVSGIAIVEGGAINVDRNFNTQLHVTFTPEPQVAPEVVWSSSNVEVVDVLADGTVVGKTVGETATITATVEGTTIKDEILVTVDLAGGESVSTNDIARVLTPLDSYTFTVPVSIMGERTVVVELLKDGSAIGSASERVTATGLATAEVTVELTSVPEIASGYSVRLTLKDGDTVLDTKTKTVEMKAPVAVTDVVLNKTTLTLAVDGSYTLFATVNPMDAANKEVEWSSDQPGIVSVDENGLVTAESTGEAVITVTTKDQAKKASCVVTVSDNSADALVIEAETFIKTGGTLDDSKWQGPGLGFKLAGTVINYGNTGDYVEYTFTVAKAGTYQVTYLIASPNDNAAVTGYVDGVAFSTDVVPNNGLGEKGWDAYEPLIAAGTVSLTAGSHTFKAEASGSNDWQWNLDKITLVPTSSDVPNSVFDLVSAGVALTPNPAIDELKITGLDNGTYTIVVSTVQGVELLTNQVVVNGSEMLNVSELPQGYYLMTILDGVSTITLPFVKAN